MKLLLVGYGDSWTFGSELDRPQEQSWVAQLATMLDADHVNMGTPASSIGHTVVQLFDFIKQVQYTDYKKIFMVGLSGQTRYLTYSNRLNEFVNITPEANYRTGNIQKTGQPPDVVTEFGTLAGELYRMVECPEYNQFLVNQTLFLFDNYCKLNNIDVIYFSYFDALCTDLDINLYPTTITYALADQEYALPEIRNNKYFAGKLFHPNMLGHTRIAELLKNFYDQKYSRH